MSLNIKDPEAHQLATALAKAAGETLTRAVTESLRERLARVEKQKTADARARLLMDLGRRCREAIEGPPLGPNELLFDERGLPK